MEKVCSQFIELINSIHVKWPSASIVISLGLCRGDSHLLNKKIQECNIILQHKSLHHKYIHLCEYSALSFRGQAIYRFLKYDQVHLNNEGVKVFVADLKYVLCKALNIRRIRAPQSSGGGGFDYYHNYEQDMNYYGSWK